jgi:two-component system chemotaxis sensor kinase CheA
VNIDDALPTFFAEAGEILREMEIDLLACTSAAPGADDVNRIFRAAHTLKGSAGLFGFDAIVEFVHEVEALLDRVRLGKAVLDTQLVAVVLECNDHIEKLLALAANGNAPPGPELLASGAKLLHALGSSPRANKAAAVQGAPLPAAARSKWHVCLRFSPDVLVAGMDPLGFLRYLNTFGAIRGMVVVEDGLAPTADLDPQKCYLGFEFAFETDAPREKIEGAFEFVRDDSTLRLVPPGSAPKVYFETLHAAGLSDGRIAQILAECGSLTANEIELALRPTESAPETVPVVSSQPAAAQASAANREGQTIRVDSLKLDNLITRIGELITAAAGAHLVARRSGNRDFEESMANVTSLVEEIREGSLQLRMVKIGATFSRFRRVVHDVSRELGKEIELQISGEETELDKTVVERIADPLTHLVRNAIDHGIESADARTARGKSAAGCIKLNAFHDSGTIVIEVSDDGGGLKRERILAKALERGLIDATDKPSDSDLFNLIFEPGFSTAEAVTNLSGRGVGMDVVKRNITALRGVVNIKSVEGAGTTVTVRLPLTLAIINGFQVGVGSSIFVLPLDSIDECVEFSAADGHDFTSLRGEVLPFIHLRTLFGSAVAPAKRQSIVVVRHGGKRAGIVVDTLLGEFQTVIKPLAKMFAQVDCVSGSSILGTGDVALILDVPAVLERAVQRSQAATNHRASSAVAAFA